MLLTNFLKASPMGGGGDTGFGRPHDFDCRRGSRSSQSREELMSQGNEEDLDMYEEAQ